MYGVASICTSVFDAINFVEVALIMLFGPEPSQSSRSVRNSPNHHSSQMRDCLSTASAPASPAPGGAIVGTSTQMRSLLTSADMFKKLVNSGANVAPEEKQHKYRPSPDFKKREPEFGRRVFKDQKEMEYHSNFLRTNIYPTEQINTNTRRCPAADVDRICVEDGFMTAAVPKICTDRTLAATTRHNAGAGSIFDFKPTEFCQDDLILPLRDPFNHLGRVRKHFEDRLLGSSPEDPSNRSEFAYGNANLAKRGCNGRGTSTTTTTFEIGFKNVPRKGRGFCRPTHDTADILNIQPMTVKSAPVSPAKPASRYANDSSSQLNDNASETTASSKKTSTSVRSQRQQQQQQSVCFQAAPSSELSECLDRLSIASSSRDSHNKTFLPSSVFTRTHNSVANIPMADNTSPMSAATYNELLRGLTSPFSASPMNSSPLTRTLKASHRTSNKGFGVSVGDTVNDEASVISSSTVSSANRKTSNKKKSKKN